RKESSVDVVLPHRDRGDDEAERDLVQQPDVQELRRRYIAAACDPPQRARGRNQKQVDELKAACRKKNFRNRAVGHRGGEPVGGKDDQIERGGDQNERGEERNAPADLVEEIAWQRRRDVVRVRRTGFRAQKRHVFVHTNAPNWTKRSGGW